MDMISLNPPESAMVLPAPLPSEEGKLGDVIVFYSSQRVGLQSLALNLPSLAHGQ